MCYIHQAIAYYYDHHRIASPILLENEDGTICSIQCTQEKDSHISLFIVFCCILYRSIWLEFRIHSIKNSWVFPHKDIDSMPSYRNGGHVCRWRTVSKMSYMKHWIHFIIYFGIVPWYIDKMVLWYKIVKAVIIRSTAVSKTLCFRIYRKTSNIRRTLVGNKIVDYSNVVGASPVGAAPTTSFST